MSRVTSPRAEPNQPFLSCQRQREAATFGLWIFLASEVVSFGAYRFLYPAAFDTAGAETNIWYGSINTAILLTSSATMAVAAWAAKAGLKRTALIGLSLTAALGSRFSCSRDSRTARTSTSTPSRDRPPSRSCRPRCRCSSLIIKAMTDVHAIHLTIGIGAVLWTAFVVLTDRTDWTRSGTLHGLAPFWHLIDVVWIVLYPLLYLAGRG